MGKILVVDDEPDIRSLLKDILDDEGYEVKVAENGESARTVYNEFSPDLVLLDIWMPDIDGISLLKEWKLEQQSNSAVVMMSGHGTVETAMEATKYGAQDFVEKPISMAKLLATVSHNINLFQESQNESEKIQNYEQLIGNGTLITNLKEHLNTALSSNHPILIKGKRGVGKHIIATHIAQLLGNIKKIEWITPRKFHLPTLHDHHCIFFVSDFSELNIDQLKSLTAVFMENEMSHKTQNIKFILSTVHDYEVFSHKLDSFPLLRDNWRFPINIPNLNDHLEDIPELLEYYSNWFSDHENLPYRHFSVSAQNKLRNQNWKGNLSELKALIRSLLSSGNHSSIELDELEPLLQTMDRQSDMEPRVNESTMQIDIGLDLKKSREQFEKQYLILQMKHVNGNISELAKRSGQDRTYLYRKLKALGIQTKKIRDH